MKTQWIRAPFVVGGLAASLMALGAAQQSTDAATTNTVQQRSGAVETKKDPKKLSPGFELAALNTLTRMQVAERRIANAIKTSLPLGEYWIQMDLDAIDEAMRIAAGSAKNDADRQALLQLKEQSDRLQTWTDWLLEQNRQLRLANYYATPTALDDDERFQNVVSCTRSLMSMLASGRLAENDSCR